MAEGLTNDVDTLRKRLKLDAEKAQQSAASPWERLALAVAGRNPDGYTEVLAADVVSVAAMVAQDDHSPRTRCLAQAALANLLAAGGKPMPDHKAKEQLFHPTTQALIDLIERTRGNPD